MSAATTRNIHGRKPGRGLRPLFLLPKVFAVAVFVGGLLSLLVLVYASGPPAGQADWQLHAARVQQAFRRVIVPASTASILFGLLLLSLHFSALIRMRWLQIKILLVFVGLPGLHLFLHHRSEQLRQAVADGDLTDQALLLRSEMLIGTTAALVLVSVIVFLGRIKPRLGKSHPRAADSGDQAHGAS